MSDFSKRFIDNPALKSRESSFITLNIKVAPVLASWRESLFSHEWLTPDGHIKSPSQMSEKIRENRKQAEAMIENDSIKLERPVLGIGIMDNIEIGAGKDVFLALAARGISTLSVHIPKSHEADFRIFIR